MEDKMINVLLTGAGFTANFGAPLASKIYEKIYSCKEIQEDNTLAGIFKNKKNINASNYEKIIQDILDSNLIDDDTKQKLREALFKVFTDEIDSHCRTPKLGTDLRRIEFLQDFLIKLFNTNEKSIFFTLNQDLFIERQCFILSSDEAGYYEHVMTKLKDWECEKIPIRYKRLGVNHRKIDVQKEYSIEQNDIIIDSASVNNAKREFEEWASGNSQNCLYIKLHGSQDFVDENNNRVLITGTNKNKQISDIELIQYYNEIFDKVLSQQSCRIIIIGYSFNDKHINDSIVKALKKENTIFYIIDNKDINELVKDLTKNRVFQLNFFDKILANFGIKQNNSNIDLLRKKINGYSSLGLTAYELENNIFKKFLPDFDKKQNIK